MSNVVLVYPVWTKRNKIYVVWLTRLSSVAMSKPVHIRFKCAKSENIINTPSRDSTR